MKYRLLTSNVKNVYYLEREKMIFFGKFRTWRSVTTIACNSKIKADLIAAAIEEIKQIEDWKTEPDTLVVEFEYESNR